MSLNKPPLSIWRLLSMNLGFFGIQFSFGLQQSNMSPIYSYLGADEAKLPYLWLAGPVTGLIVQPIIGALSDRTVSRWGRRRPYFLAGAVLCSLGLWAMPNSSSLWMAAGLLWLLDAGNNVTMEPYRAFVVDRLDPRQQSLGFMVQSAFTGLGQTLAYLSPALLVWLGFSAERSGANGIPEITVAAFDAGALISIVTIVWTLVTTPELPMTESERLALSTRPRGAMATLREIGGALIDMPPTMRRLFWVCLLQWYAMFCYWQYIVPALARILSGDSGAGLAALRNASLVNAHLGAFYNFVAFIGAIAMAPLTRRHGAAQLHSACLLAAGLSMLAIPYLGDERLLLIAMLGIGLGWASMMANPYALVAASIPLAQTGIYMGIFNLFIVIPMLIQTVTLPSLFPTLLGGNSVNVIRLAGALMLGAAFATKWTTTARALPSTEPV